MNATPSAATSAPQGAARLEDWGVIRASGEDARKFVHGQLTQDIEHLPAGSACLAGYCSAKGRLLASFVVWAPAPDELLLACSADLLPAVLKRLSMFVLRSKCKLVDASADVPLWGLAGDAVAAARLQPWACAAVDGGALIRLPDALAEGVAVPRALATAAPALPELSLDAWRWLEVMSGTARIVAATAEQFVPQMINFELVGGVNFQKGCYPGQEVIARSQYRGTLKRRGCVVASAVALQPGQEIFHSADPGQPAGMVVLAGSLAGGRHAALVELKLAALHGGRLHAGSASGDTLSVATLPYVIPAEAA